MEKIGLVLEGGAFRGIFTSGVLDYLMEKDMKFDYIAGVSAGAGNGMNFITHQIGRTRNVIRPDRKVTYYGMKQLLTKGKFLNLDKMFYEYPFKQFPYDAEAFKKNNTKIEIVVSNCDTGKAEYHTETDDLLKFLSFGKASCSVPILCAPVKINGYHYLDGSICDSVPAERAILQGCDKILVVMTKSLHETPTDYGTGAMKELMAVRYKKKYPKFYEALIQRTTVYKKQMEYLNKLVDEGRALVLRPEIPVIKKFEKDDEKAEAFYQDGINVARKRYEEIANFLYPEEKLSKVSGGLD